MKNRNKKIKTYLFDRETDAEQSGKEKEIASYGLKGLIAEAKRNAESEIWSNIGLSVPGSLK